MSTLSHGSIPLSLIIKWKAKEKAMSVGIQMVAI